MHYYNYLGTRGCLFTHWIEAIKLSYLLRSANGIQCYCSSRWDNLGKGLCRFLLAVFPRNLKCQRMKQSGKNERGFFRDKTIERNEMVRINNKTNLFESG